MKWKSPDDLTHTLRINQEIFNGHVDSFQLGDKID